MARQGFRFEPLLGWAEQREEQQTRVLGAAVQEEDALRLELARLEAEREQEWSRLAHPMPQFDAEARRAAITYVELLTERIELQLVAVGQARERVATARDVLLEILKEKRSLEHLRERDEAEVAREEGRREATATDELNMARHARRDPSAGTGGLGGFGRGAA